MVDVRNIHCSFNTIMSVLSCCPEADAVAPGHV
jgi:hypothetical protein